jgi:hypothetical protein
VNQPALQPRRKALEEVRKRFIARGYPRLVVSLILGLSGLVAFGFSASALALGLDHMPMRYLLATIAGYGVFLALIRVWIALHRIGWHVDLPVPDLGGLPSHTSNAAFGGGRSGGAGATGSWQSPSIAVPDIDVDVDEGWPLLLAAVLFLGGVIAMLYVVYAAPVLLAEVALDAALVTGIYRKLRKQDAGHWLGSALRHTWLPALIAAICMYAAGMALEVAAPDARSIGDVVRAVRE